MEIRNQEFKRAASCSKGLEEPSQSDVTCKIIHVTTIGDLTRHFSFPRLVCVQISACLCLSILLLFPLITTQLPCFPSSPSPLSPPPSFFSFIHLSLTPSFPSPPPTHPRCGHHSAGNLLCWKLSWPPTQGDQGDDQHGAGQVGQNGSLWSL